MNCECSGARGRWTSAQQEQVNSYDELINNGVALLANAHLPAILSEFKGDPGSLVTLGTDQHYVG